MLRKLAVPLLAVTLGCPWAAYPRDRDLTVSEGGDLVMQALDPTARKLRKLSIELEAIDTPGFYQYAVTWDNPNGGVVLGFFGVNKATGDVWRMVVCGEMNTPDLRRLQKKVRKDLGLVRREAVKLGKVAPCVP